MNKLDSEITITSENAVDIEKISLNFATKLDFIDVQILRKFYVTGKEFPNDTAPYCFPILYREMKENGQLKIGMEGFRKRLDNLVRVGFLEKIKLSNPTNYMPRKGKENLVRAIIVKFFLIHGLTKFL